MSLTNQQLLDEFSRQVENLISKGYPQMAGMSEEDFLAKVTPLKDVLADMSLSEVDVVQGILPFVIVIKSELLASEKMMELVERDARNGVTILRPHTSQHFKTIEDVELPSGIAYLMVDIDRGKESINLPPIEAINSIQSVGRSPLTIDEGIALVTHFPEFLIKNNCYSLLASRTGSDKRVPAIWINAKKEPNLGWCWDGNPHTWLGSASCGKRYGTHSNL